jgi:hypothetical protein
VTLKWYPARRWAGNAAFGLMTATQPGGIGLLKQ